jgi:hypothetical protein
MNCAYTISKTIRTIVTEAINPQTEKSQNTPQQRTCVYRSVLITTQLRYIAQFQYDVHPKVTDTPDGHYSILNALQPVSLFVTEVKFVRLLFNNVIGIEIVYL